MIFGHFFYFGHFPIEIPIEAEKFLSPWEGVELQRKLFPIRITLPRRSFLGGPRYIRIKNNQCLSLSQLCSVRFQSEIHIFNIRKCSTLKVEFSANFHALQDFFWWRVSSHPQNWKNEKIKLQISILEGIQLKKHEGGVFH